MRESIDGSNTILAALDDPTNYIYADFSPDTVTITIEGLCVLIYECTEGRNIVPDLIIRGRLLFYCGKVMPDPGPITLTRAVGRPPSPGSLTRLRS
jgi:hypothetical protein